MKDMVPNGTGNSRYLKSIENFLTQYPTYADFAAALSAGTLPIDLNGLNPDGIQQIGTPLSKSTLLSDEVAETIAALSGADSPGTPNEALNILAAIVSELKSGAVKIETGSYVGTGASGSSNPNSLTFGFEPSMLVIFDSGGKIIYTYSSYVAIGFTKALTESYKDNVLFRGGTALSDYTYSKCSEDRKTISWYNLSSSSYQMNSKNSTYYYLAIG